MPVYNYTTLDGPFLGDETFANGINAAGLIVGYYIFFGHHHGFIYNPNDSTYTSVDALSPALSSHYVDVQFTDTYFYSINASGKIVGYAQETTPAHSDPDSFLYSGEIGRAHV